jgi:hypothetical protein
MANSKKTQNGKDLGGKPKKSEKTLKIEDPSLLAEKMTEEQMGRFLQELMKL